MKKRIIFLSLALAISFIIIFFTFRTCSRRNNFIDPAFSEYISAFTSGRISVNAAIRIELAKEIPSVELNVPVDKKLFSFSPSLRGEAYWIDNRTIEFRPAKPMEQGTTYQVEFYLSKLLKVPKNLKTFIYSFETITQAVSFEMRGYQPYQFTNLEWNEVDGTILTADFADDGAIEKMVTASQNGKRLKVTWNHKKDVKEHVFKLDSVYRGEKASEVILKWEGSAIGAKGSGEEKVIIPSIYDFYVLETKVEQVPNPYVSIRFSDPIDPKQNLDGIIHSSDIAGFTFEVNGMEVKAYPTTSQSGTASIEIEQGILNVAGSKLKERQVFQVLFESIKPAVRILGKGVILPNSNGLIVPFEAVNLKAVDLRIIKIYENNIGQFLQVNQLDGGEELHRAGRLVLKKTIRLGTDKPIVYNKWNTFSIDLSKLIQQEPGAIYRVQLSFKQKYSAYPCEGSEKIAATSDLTAIEDADSDENENEMQKWDDPEAFYYGGEYDSYGEDYEWKDRENPCTPSYYYGSERIASRNILASNIGIIAKGNSNNMLTIALADLITTKPLDGVQIEVYNFQRQIIGSATSNKDGFCTLQPKGKAFLIIAKSGDQRGYLRVDDGSSLSLSNFDVTGQVVQKGLKGFIYGERGVWRPGDSIYLTFVLEDKLQTIPANHPVILDVINPQGKKIKHITKTSGENGFYIFSFNTSENDITGNYQANIRIGINTFSKTLKIETIKPNRLKINFDFGTEVIQSNNQKATLNVKWLHGAPARNMKANVAVTLSAANTIFKGFEGYVFDDPTKIFNAEEQTIFDGTIDNNGDAVVKADLTIGHAAPGMLRANFITRIFEPGGDFSIDRLGVLYSPFTSYVGIKSPEGQFHYVYTDTEQFFDVVSVNDNGQLVNRKNLDFKVYKMDWQWWWSSDDGDLANFTSNTLKTPFFSSKISTIKGKAKVPFRLNYPNWGRFLVVVTDPESGHSTGSVVYFDWPMWRGRADRGDAKGATMLTFTSEKKAYKVGDKASITVPTPPNSRMLVSLETGSEILKAWWVESKGAETRINFDITEAMTPNVYVYVSLIQPHAQVVNDLPIRMYGIIPLTVENPESKLMPVITMANVLKPEQNTTIRVNEKNNKPMTYTLAIIDDGLLDLTRFKTPDPYIAFNGREALGIKTWDLYDMVLGAYGGKMEQLFSIGGDDAIVGKGGAKAQRFKPVVKFLGPFTLKSGSKLHSIQLPPYIGSVRVMVIAGNKGTFGSAEKTVSIRKPLMVLATLPRVLGPGEEVDLPVTIFAMEKSIKCFNVEIGSNEHFSVLGAKSKSMDIKETGEYDMSFRLKINSKTGIGKVKVLVSSGKERAEYSIEIQVRNPNPKIVKYIDFNLDATSSSNVNYELNGLPGTSKAILEVSSIPAIDLSRKLEYLLQYPYGCAEQTTSAAFPQLYVNKFTELSAVDMQRRDEHINFAIHALSGLLNSEGGVMYWPGMPFADDWVTSYAGHFMLEAEKLGYSLPSGFINNWLRYQKKQARSWTAVNHYGDLAQAYRLYTLALAKDPEIGAMNRMKEMKGLSMEASWRLAAAYALIGRADEARLLIRDKSSEAKNYLRFNTTYGSVERDWAMMLETMCLLKDKNGAFQLVKKISAAMSGNYWFSTQSTAYCLLAVGKFIDLAKWGNEMHFSWQLAGKNSEQVTTKLPVARITLPTKEKGSYRLNLKNLSKGTLFVRLVTEGIPETGPEAGFENNLKMSIIYKNASGTNIDVSKLSQGTDFMAEVTVHNVYPASDITNMALSHVFPSGWEIVNTRFLNDTEASGGSTNYTYRDFRDDRVYTFFDLPLGVSKTFIVKLTAAYTGKFYLPGTLCEAMYEPGINAFVPGKWVEVVR